MPTHTKIMQVSPSKLRSERANPPKDTQVSFKGRNVLVTGANTGLGLEAAVKFTNLGADMVILAVRSLAKGEHAKVEIETRTGRKGVVQVRQLDMSNYDSIRSFVAQIEAEVPGLHVAVLNAGMLANTFEKSKYGFERTLQVNVVSTTLLALLLLPKLKASKTVAHTPVLEIISSGLQNVFERLASDDDGAGPLTVYNRAWAFTPYSQYAVSKLFVEVAHVSLAKLADPDVYVTTVCPGATASSLARESKATLMGRISLWIFKFMQRTAEEGSRIYITGTTFGAAGQGAFISNDKITESKLLAGAEGEKFQARVWSEIIEGLQKDVPEVRQLAGL